MSQKSSVMQLPQFVPKALTSDTNSKAAPDWVLRLAERRPANDAVVALANKMARTIWALLAHDRIYQERFVSRPV